MLNIRRGAVIMRNDIRLYDENCSLIVVLKHLWNTWHVPARLDVYKKCPVAPFTNMVQL